MNENEDLIFNQGFDSALNGKHRVIDNPYDDRVNRQKWLDGFDAGMAKVNSK